MTNEEKNIVNPFSPYEGPKEPLDEYPYGSEGHWGIAPVKPPEKPNSKEEERVRWGYDPETGEVYDEEMRELYELAWKYLGPITDIQTLVETLIALGWETIAIMELLSLIGIAYADYQAMKLFFEWYKGFCKDVEDFVRSKAIEQGRRYGPGHHYMPGYIAGAFSPFINKATKSAANQGGATANAVVHVSGGNYTFNVDKLDGDKLKQILEQIRSEVRPKG